MQSRTREGAGIAGWRLVRIRGREARRPRRHAAYLSCVSRAARRPGGRRTVHRWLCSPLVTAGDAGGLETHHEAGGFAARLSRDARAERLRRASARVEVEDARGHSTPQTVAHDCPQRRTVRPPGGIGGPRRALRRRDWYSHTTGARDAATQALFSYLTTISCLRLDFVDRLVGKRYMGGSYDRGMPPPCLHGRWRWEQSEALSSEIRGPPRGGARAPRRRFHQRRHAATCDGAPVRDDARGEEGRGGTLDSLAPARPTRVGRGGAPRIAWRRVGALAMPCGSRPRRATAHPRLVPCVSQPTPRE